jgi:hypothetical protein
MKKTRNTKFGVLLGLVALGLLCTIVGTVAADNTTSTQGMQLVDDIQPYNGPIGANNSMYGLKIAFENLDDFFTFNQTDKLAKEIDHADLRLAELKEALAANRTDAADRALDQYWQNLNQTERTLEWFNQTSPIPAFNRTGSMPAPIDKGIMHVQDMIIKHQVVLENLLSSHSGNPGLARAYNNSRELELKFEQKTQTRFERVKDANNRIWLRAEHLSSGAPSLTQNRTIPTNAEGRYTPTVNRMVPEVWNQSWQNTGQTWNRTVQSPRETNPSQQDQHRPAIQVIPSHIQSPSNNQENRNGNGSGTGGWTDNGNSNRNGNGDTRFPNR